MTVPSQSGFPSTVKHHRHQDTMAAAANRLAEDARRRWAGGKEPNVAHLLELHPELRSCKSLVLDLAHEEFRRRLAAGEAIDSDEFCQRFPSFQHSLHMLIEVERLLGGDEGLQALFAEPQWPVTGESYLGYSLTGELGRGTFARVYLASEASLGGRLVALKVSPGGGDEAEIIGKLQHPGIVPVYSVKEDPANGLTAICMPYLGRTTLADVLDKAFVDGLAPRRSGVIAQTISELHDDSDLLRAAGFDQTLRRGSYVESVVHLTVQVAEALAFAHSRGVCHLDLKPSNVLLSVEGRPLLLDFNLSADGEGNNCRVGGTLPYMAPEQLLTIAHAGRENIGPPDPRSDLFSLGVILYQLLFGKLPFGSIPRELSIEEVAAKMLRRQEQGPLKLREQDRHVDGPLVKIVERCLAFNPDDRFQSALVLAESLRTEITPVRRARRWTRNHPRSVLAATFLSVVLVAALAAFFALRDPYDIRQLEQGLRYVKQGEDQLAAEFLNRSLAANPGNPEAYFARGRVRQKLGLYDLAATDFYEALKIKPEGKLFACEGFCASKLGRHSRAVTLYVDAMESGFKPPGLLNNLGFACIMLNRTTEARRYLQKATEAAPELQAAHNNLILLNLREASIGKPVTLEMVLHAVRTAKKAPPSGELCFQVALLLARAGRNDSRWVEPTKDHLRRSVSHGVNPESITSAPELSYLRDDPEFQAVLQRPASETPLVKPIRVVDPLEAD